MANKGNRWFHAFATLLKLPRLRRPTPRERLIAYALLAILIFCWIMDAAVLRSLTELP